MCHYLPTMAIPHWISLCYSSLKWSIFISAVLLNGVPGNFTKDSPCPEQRERGSFLWTIKRNPPAYMFGTIHVPYTRVWDYVPQKSKRAFANSNNVYFELDLTDAKTITALAECQMLPDDTSLQDVLPVELYQRLKNHLDYVKRTMPDWVTEEQEGRGLYADYLFEAITSNWERKRPAWVMLMVNSLTEADIRTRGMPVLDLHLARQAAVLGKSVGAVEKVEEQCNPLNSLNTTQVLFALNHTLTMQELVRTGGVDVPYTTDDLIEQYNCGDLSSAFLESDSSQISKLLNTSSMTTMQDQRLSNSYKDDAMSTAIDGYFKDELIYRRNARMAQRIKALLSDKPHDSFFFAFGAGHFLGNGSVIDFLKKDGFIIEHSNSDNDRSHAFDPGPFTDNNSLPSSIKWIEEEVVAVHEQQTRHSSRSSREEKGRHKRRGRKQRYKDRRRRRKSRRNKKTDKFNDIWIRAGSERVRESETTFDQSFLQPTMDNQDNDDDLTYHSNFVGVRVVDRHPTPVPFFDETWKYGSWMRFKPLSLKRGGRTSHASGYRTRRHHTARKPEPLSIELWAENHRRFRQIRQMPGAATSCTSIPLQTSMVLLLTVAFCVLLTEPR